MTEKEFKKNAEVDSKEYKAVCYSENKHWEGDWRKTYSEAYEEGEIHSKEYPFHDVRIDEKLV